MTPSQKRAARKKATDRVRLTRMIIEELKRGDMHPRDVALVMFPRHQHLVAWIWRTL